MKMDAVITCETFVKVYKTIRRRIQKTDKLSAVRTNTGKNATGTKEIIF